MREVCASSNEGDGGLRVDEDGGGGGGGGEGGTVSVGPVGSVGVSGRAVMVNWAPVTSIPVVELDTVSLFELPVGIVLAETKVKLAVPFKALAGIVKVKGVTAVKSVPAAALSPATPPTVIVKSEAEVETVAPDGKEALTVT